MSLCWFETLGGKNPNTITPELHKIHTQEKKKLSCLLLHKQDKQQKIPSVQLDQTGTEKVESTGD